MQGLATPDSIHNGFEALVIDPATKPSAKLSQLLLRFFPSLTDLAFLIPIVALFGFGDAARTLLADCDTGWQIRTGDWILQHGQVPHKDIFSFTMPDQTWFAWEWGWDVLFSMIHSKWALSGVVLANSAILGLVAILLYRLVRRQAANDALAFLVTSIALFASSVHWLARPHMVSWLFILAFLHLIDRAEHKNTLVLWWCPIITLFWTNIHGSFFLSPAFLLVYGAVNALQGLLFRSRQRSIWQALLEQRSYFLCGLACLAVSLANPYGWHLHEHVMRYLLDAKQLDQISEYASINFHSPAALRFEVLLILGVCAAWHAFAKMQCTQGLMILLWAHLALNSARNIPVFVFVAAPPIAAFLSASLRRVSEKKEAGRLPGIAGALLSFGQDFRPFERVERVPMLPVAVLALIAAGLGLGLAGQPRISDFDSRDFPSAAASIIGKLARPRVFTFDQWGDYLAYRFFPQRMAFVDDRSDFYGAAFTEKWVKAFGASYEWHSELSRFSIDTVLLKTNTPLASVLKESSEWSPIFDDGRAILFRKKTTRSSVIYGLARRSLAALPDPPNTDALPPA